MTPLDMYVSQTACPAPSLPTTLLDYLDVAFDPVRVVKAVMLGLNISPSLFLFGCLLLASWSAASSSRPPSLT